MRTTLLIRTLILVGLTAGTVQAQSILPSLGSSRAGTSGYQFLKIAPDPRSAGMGQSNVADAIDASSLYWNPALAAQMTGSEAYLAHTAYFADIALNYAAYVHRSGSRAFGVSLHHLDSGLMNETTEFDPFGTGRQFRTNHMALGVSYAQQLTTLFSYGITAKYINERVMEVNLTTGAVDLGFFYRVGDTGLRFAIGINNFGFDSDPDGSTTRTTLEGDVIETEFERLSPPTTFIMGAAYNVIRKEPYDLLLTAQLTNPSDNAERMSLGTEFRYMRTFFVRTGYEFGVDEAALPAFGAGVDVPVGFARLALNYGFTTRDRLGELHRVGMQIRF